MHKVKRKLATLLIVAMSINCFATSVSNNDGSAFITKAEFDALKSNFQAQLDQYNQGIDSKIDSAIASYLAGINIKREIDLKLPDERGYTFPLRYETAEVWNDPRSLWHIPVRPECHRTDYKTMFFTGRYSGNGHNWTSYSTVSNADTATIPGEEPYEKWMAVDVNKYTLSIKPRITDGFTVEKTTDTRYVNSGTYKIYDITNWGLGYQVVNYQAEPIFEVYSGNAGAVIRNYGYPNNEYYYPYCFGFSHNWQSLSAASAEPLKKHTAWRTNELWWSIGGNTTRYTNKDFGTTLPYTGPDENLYTLMAKYRAQRGAQGDQKSLISETQKVDNTNAVFSTTQKTGRVYGRGASCPIIGDNFNLELIEGAYNSDKWWNQVYFYDGPTALGVVSAATISNVAILLSNNHGFLPNNIVAANTIYDASDSEYYSKLPSPLLRYKTDAGDTHYIDEGMWLGKIDESGLISFDLKFEKDSGSGTKVKLHISKKPFSIDCIAADLIDITVNGTKSKEPQLSYGTDYSIKIEHCEKNDNLYLEWIPVDTADLSKLSVFENFMLTITD